jgi:hypothetical protein
MSRNPWSLLPLDASRGSRGGFDAAADLLRHDPFLADFVIGEEAAGQEGVAAVVDGQIRERGAAAARNEEDELGPVALLGGIVGPLEPHRSAQELHDRVQRSRHADAIDRAAQRPIGPLRGKQRRRNLA